MGRLGQGCRGGLCANVHDLQVLYDHEQVLLLVSGQHTGILPGWGCRTDGWCGPGVFIGGLGASRAGARAASGIGSRLEQSWRQGRGAKQSGRQGRAAPRNVRVLRLKCCSWMGRCRAMGSQHRFGSLVGNAVAGPQNRRATTSNQQQVSSGAGGWMGGGASHVPSGSRGDPGSIFLLELVGTSLAALSDVGHLPQSLPVATCHSCRDVGPGKHRGGRS